MRRIDIKGYKSIANLSLQLASINIFIGSNGSGKSNFLSFFDFLKRIYLRSLKEHVALNGGVDRFLHKGRKITEDISAHLDFGKNAYAFNLKAGINEFIFTKEILSYKNHDVDISQSETESRLHHATLHRVDYLSHYLNSLEKYHFHDTSKNSPFTKISNIYNDIERII